MSSVVQVLSPQAEELQARKRELADLRLLLTRRTGLAALMDTLGHEVRQRVPEETPEPEPEDTTETPTVISITANELQPPEKLTSENVDEWINDLRERLMALLSEYNEIRFKE